MSGHSHAATIRRDKEATDAKKGAAFSKIGRLITVAVKESGGIADPDKNAKLKLALEKAKEVNMPKDNIERAIERGLGKTGGAALESITYEGYGPAGTAFVVECITDNRNRTGAEIKNLFTQAGGNLAEPGAASHFFERKGLIKVIKEVAVEEQMLKLIDLGAEDIQEAGDCLEVFVPLNLLDELKKKITAAQFKIQSSEMILRPKTKLSLSATETEKVSKFQQKLLNHDDVQKVFINL
jgi:YebC/PmpR family DNA-binding regulatory protein